MIDSLDTQEERILDSSKVLAWSYVSEMRNLSLMTNMPVDKESEDEESEDEEKGEQEEGKKKKKRQAYECLYCSRSIPRPNHSAMRDESVAQTVENGKKQDAEDSKPQNGIARALTKQIDDGMNVDDVLYDDVDDDSGDDDSADMSDAGSHEDYLGDDGLVAFGYGNLVVELLRPTEEELGKVLQSDSRLHPRRDRIHLMDL